MEVMLENYLTIDIPTSISFQLTLTKAIAVANLDSTLLYCEPIAHFTIVGSFPQMIQLHLFNISLDR